MSFSFAVASASQVASHHTTASGSAASRLVGAILLEQNDEWAVQRRYMSLETFAPISDAPDVSLAVAAD